MERILVLQLTRMGDTLQTTPLLEGLRNKYPDCYLCLLMVPGAAKVLRDNPAVNDIITVDTQTLLDELVGEDSAALLRSYGEVRRILDRLRELKFDRVINLSHNRTSAYLIRLLGVPNVEGLALADDWMRVIKGRWPTYFINSVFNRAYNDFNIVDVYRRFGGELPPHPKLVLPISDADREYAAKLLKDNGVSDGDFVVCFQPGASEETKRWPTRRFAELGDMLVRDRGAKVVLLGTEAERRFGNEILERMTEPAIDTFGRTNIPQVAALLDRSDVLVTNDTGVMHIASTTSARIIVLCFSMVYFRETGPYGGGHVIVQSRIDCTPCPVSYNCHDRRCAEHITPSSVVRAMDLAENVDPSRPNQVDDDESLETVNIFVSRFGPDGMVEYVPLVRRPLTTQDALALAYRMMWLEFLDGRVVDEDARIRDLLGFYLPPEPDTVQPFLDEAKAGFDRFASVAADAAEMTGNLLVELGSPTRNAATLQQTVQELNRLDEFLRVLGKSEEYLQPLSSIFFFEKENLEGDDPMILAQHTLQMYRDAEQRARLMAGKLDTLIALGT